VWCSGSALSAAEEDGCSGSMRDALAGEATQPRGMAMSGRASRAARAAGTDSAGLYPCAARRRRWEAASRSAVQLVTFPLIAVPRNERFCRPYGGVSCANAWEGDVVHHPIEGTASGVLTPAARWSATHDACREARTAPFEGCCSWQRLQAACGNPSRLWEQGFWNDWARNLYSYRVKSSPRARGHEDPGTGRFGKVKGQDRHLRPLSQLVRLA